MKTMLVFVLALCALTAAFVPRDRRAVDPDDPALAPTPAAPVPSTATVCAPQTACGWSFYKPDVKVIDLNITNNYCVCPVGTTCQMADEDSTSSFYNHRCQPPEEEHTEDDSS